MHVRRIRQRNKAGDVRQYIQIVESYRREDGVPTSRVLAHLGRGDDLLYENLRTAFAAARAGQPVVEEVESTSGSVSVSVEKSLVYLPAAVVSHFYRQVGLDQLLDKLCPPGQRMLAASTVVEALVAHRCIEPGSKLAFQRWLDTVAVKEVFGCSRARLNNTRVHRCLDELAAVDEQLQERLAQLVRERQGNPLVLYLDLTDTWFEAGGGSLARRGQTKQGHRSKRKINIALMVEGGGLPLRWELLPGALNETTVLPSWLDHLQGQKHYDEAVLTFDRGLPSVDNFNRLLDAETGHLFLTSIKSDAIPTYIELDRQALTQLQELPDDATTAAIAEACGRLRLTASVTDPTTFRTDCGLVSPPKPKTRGKKQLPDMRMYLYFNPDIWQTRRAQRRERLESARAFVDRLNEDLARAKQSRRPEPIRDKVVGYLRKLKLFEAHDVVLEPIEVQGRTKPISSFQVRVEPKPDVLRNMCRHDGLCLLVGHPDLSLSCDEAITVYRLKNAVEADFRTIKSVLDLRPTFHWTDKKILAHVTLCVLALLTERLMEQRLKAAPSGYRSAAAALDEMEEVRLHRLRIDDASYVCQTDHGTQIDRLARTLGVGPLLQRFSTRVTARTGVEMDCRH